MQTAPRFSAPVRPPLRGSPPRRMSPPRAARSRRLPACLQSSPNPGAHLGHVPACASVFCNEGRVACHAQGCLAACAGLVQLRHMRLPFLVQRSSTALPALGLRSPADAHPALTPPVPAPLPPTPPHPCPSVQQGGRRSAAGDQVSARQGAGRGARTRKPVSCQLVAGPGPRRGRGPRHAARRAAGVRRRPRRRPLPLCLGCEPGPGSHPQLFQPACQPGPGHLPAHRHALLPAQPAAKHHASCQRSRCAAVPGLRPALTACTPRLWPCSRQTVLNPALLHCPSLPPARLSFSVHVRRCACEAWLPGARATSMPPFPPASPTPHPYPSHSAYSPCPRSPTAQTLRLWSAS